ncbi:MULTISPECIES: hypothetical protein [Neisseria]|uniref:DUF7683 domain-containing protein n=1 Tax=Neisseria animaloris TaxID=326522 RepID=A0A448UC94_9NEIS|nr:MULTISPECIES: hypothetical protein [Neisseria]MDO1510415.1 hypothetical protein [Neisseria sp. MVDL19-042950]MDO1516584.1 hypothetical protein [Neisseria sp. MVDL18-041461]MDO1563730.1 hypothetical protein [Neisseria sp. MVDL20-010259]VEJ21504.1 Uncharacterised protein [Neisseria animaloris]
MKKIIRFISKFEKFGEEFIGVLNFKNEPSLEFLQTIFNETGPMYEEYWITKEIAEIIEPYLDEKLEINKYDYFLSCEENIV